MERADRPEEILPEIPEEVRAGLKLGLVRAEPVAVGPAAPSLREEMERLRAELAAEHAGRKPSEIARLAPARELYRTFGVDPTRTRPSSEALLRRVLQGKALPSILNAVDVCNLCSLRFLLPIGLYDTAKIRGPVRLRRGGAGDSYPGIRKDRVHLEGRLALVDEEGPFGNPSSDSLRTSVTESTRSLWMVLFAPATFPVERLEANVHTARETIARHLAPPGEAVSHSGAVI
jgi:DNA/RNA-binding domain of Phe-tRNA-synthetase-like protein